ncbi:hypothetical protein [Ancylomarina sp.]|uniref:hypothetical protein n=1 Tax=Ancylomarina sp. TaxID=1970196 RepID=UPI0035641A81
MNLNNNKYVFLAWLLALAFTLPLLVKAEHLMFPNHEHHNYSCQHSKSDLEDVCEILEFDYFFFVPSDVISIPTVSVIEFNTFLLDYSQFTTSKCKLGYSLRAPPSHASFFVLENILEV